MVCRLGLGFAMLLTAAPAFAWSNSQHQTVGPNVDFTITGIEPTFSTWTEQASDEHQTSYFYPATGSDVAHATGDGSQDGKKTSGSVMLSIGPVDRTSGYSGENDYGIWEQGVGYNADGSTIGIEFGADPYSSHQDFDTYAKQAGGQYKHTNGYTFYHEVNNGPEFVLLPIQPDGHISAQRRVDDIGRPPLAPPSRRLLSAGHTRTTPQHFNHGNLRRSITGGMGPLGTDHTLTSATPIMAPPPPDQGGLAALHPTGSASEGGLQPPDGNCNHDEQDHKASAYGIMKKQGAGLWGATSGTQDGAAYTEHTRPALLTQDHQSGGSGSLISGCAALPMGEDCTQVCRQ